LGPEEALSLSSQIALATLLGRVRFCAHWKRAIRIRGTSANAKKSMPPASRNRHNGGSFAAMAPNWHGKISIVAPIQIQFLAPPSKAPAF